MLMRCPTRTRTVFLMFGSFLLLYHIVLRWRPNFRQQAAIWRLSLANQSCSNADPHLQNMCAQVEFWRFLASCLDANPPGVASPVRKANAEAVSFDAEKSQRPEVLEMPEQDVATMRRAHSRFVQAIEGGFHSIVYTHSTKGFVSTAGGFYFPILMTSLRMLRRTGATLPMEVFLELNSEYESFICEHMLPSLNARCIILSEILEAIPYQLPISHYQLKVFAMAFSSFEEVLFLDADAFPIYDPTRLFNFEPFKSTGLVTWPDFWGPTQSSLFYSVTSQAVPPATNHASTESGEILLSKKKQNKTLILAMYYNYYGPNHFYPLLSQGVAGEGDKETFLAAAHTLHQPYYATRKPVKAIGNFQKGQFAGSAMVQYDPFEENLMKVQPLVRTENALSIPPPRALFVHVNFPKFDPAKIFTYNGIIKFENGTFRRAWGEPLVDFEYDVEEAYWREMNVVSCTMEGKTQGWRGIDHICANATRYYNSVFGAQSAELGSIR